ncbi:MAG: response regulator transcription factor [Treponemataceae bacterium]|nr:response regulator transcription factor [Treponemataceae bacterium]
MKSEKNILVVEDSERLNDFISSQLTKNNYSVTQAFNGKQAFKNLKNSYFDLVILDIKLGDIDGLQILKTIRSQDKTLPVMIISSISDDETKIEGFRIGCDDYLTKPFYANDMIMRVNRMIERSKIEGFQHTPVHQVISAGPFEADIASQALKKNGNVIPMRKKYFDIMVYFMKHPNIVIPFRTLYEQVWNKEAADQGTIESNLYVNIRNLRMLVEDDTTEPSFIQTVRHTGYIFVA